VQPSVKMVMRAVSQWPTRATLARTNEEQQQEQDGASEIRGKHATTRRREKETVRERKGTREQRYE